MRKSIIALLVWLVLVPFGYSSNFVQKDNKYSTIGSLNTLRLGQGKKNINLLAKSISIFDIVGLQEVMKKSIMSDLEKELEEVTKVDWEYHVSDRAVGISRSHKEYYAFIWRSDKVKPLQSLGFYEEVNDSDFSREPYAVMFQIGKMDFTLVLCHFIFGKRKQDRRNEANKLYDVYTYFQTKNGYDQDVFIMGDFNLHGEDKSFSLLKSFDGIKNGLGKKDLTSINSKGDMVSAYDNIFYSKYSYSEVDLIFIHFQRQLIRYRKEVSDHLPIGMVVKINRDDD